MNRFLALGLALATGCATSPDLSESSQLVTVDTTTGIGFVGKGAVQSRFHWNNADLQANAAGITFSYEVTGIYEQSCLHATGNEHKTVEKTFKKTVELSADVASAARRNPQNKVNGFHLTGIAATSGDLPPTDLCNPGQSEPDDIWIADLAGAYPQVTQTSGSPATLYVSFGGVSYPIWTEGDESDAAEPDAD